MLVSVGIVRTVYNGILLIVLGVTVSISFVVEYCALNVCGLTAARCVSES